MLLGLKKEGEGVESCHPRKVRASSISPFEGTIGGSASGQRRVETPKTSICAHLWRFERVAWYWSGTVNSEYGI